MELPVARITKDAVYFDGEKLPGFIVENGVTAYPGGATGVNRLEVTFLVGRVDMEDPCADSV